MNTAPQNCAGTLYIVATPIGNLEDISQRALRILAEVDCIAAEDTRHTRKLLTTYDISTRLMSTHGHNEEARAGQIVERLERGDSIALVSDAGTPAIADPGARVVAAVRAAQLPVVPIPGPNAAVTALSAAGITSPHFTFIGFLPEKPGRRRRLLTQLATLPHPVIYYCSKWDLKRQLPDMITCCGNREVLVYRELTKHFEEFRRGTVEETLTWATSTQPKGEFTLIVLPEPPPERES